MTITKAAYTPTDGIKNTGSFPSPATRLQLQTLLDQIKDDVNVIVDELEAGALDGRYYTETEIDGLVSGLQGQITTNDGKLTTHKTSTDHDGRYYTEAEMGSTTVGSSGATKIGASSDTGVTGATVEAQIKQLKTEQTGIVLGEIPDNTLTEAKMQAEMKKQAGGVAPYDIALISETAGGTATAITLAGINIVNGFTKTFIASATDASSAKTINGKNFYKAGGALAPSITSGKAYTVWYNLAGDCFFLKASAEGTAVAANVLAGTTFSNDSNTGISGTMVDRSGDTAATSSSVSGTTLKLLATEGYRDGANDNVTITDADFVAGNIKNAINIFGLTGTYSAKSFATGTLTSTAAQNFTKFDGTTVSKPTATVTGLSFTPSIIIVSLVSGKSDRTFFADGTYNLKYGATDVPINLIPNNGAGISFQKVSPASVTTGFVLPVDNLGVSYDWIAIA